MKPLDDWIAGRSPPAPMTLTPWLSDGAGAGALTASALAALQCAESRPGRVREAAFDLLAADALVTYACEAALETEEPEVGLRDVLAAVMGGT